MTIFTITTEVEAETLHEAWVKSAHGHPIDFRPSSDWSGFKSFSIQGDEQVITLSVEQKENN